MTTVDPTREAPPTATTANPSQNETAAPEQTFTSPVPFPPYPHNGVPGYPPTYFNYGPPPDAGDGTNGQPGQQVMYPPPPPGMMYAFPPQPGHPPFPMPPPQQHATTPKSKRKQVKMACTNCAAACKRCDEVRPCMRCRKYGFAETCQDGQRKERRKGVKRGPYKRKGKGDTDESAFSFTDGEPVPADPSQWVSQPTPTPENASASGSSPPAQGGQPAPPHSMYPPPPPGTYPEGYPFPPPLPWMYPHPGPPGPPGPYYMPSEAMAAANGQPPPGHEVPGHPNMMHTIQIQYMMQMGMPLGIPPHPYAYSPAQGMFPPGMVPMPPPPTEPLKKDESQASSPSISPVPAPGAGSNKRARSSSEASDEPVKRAKVMPNNGANKSSPAKDVLPPPSSP